jgi:hypothetical protein
MCRKRIGVAAGVTLLMAGIISGALASSAAAGSENGPRHSSLWALQPVGSWVWTTDLGPLGKVPVLITFHVDGTIAVADGFMFANPIAPPAGQGAKRGPAHGVWRYTGGRTFGGTSLWLRFNSSGFMEGWARSRSALELVDPDHFQGVVYIETLGGCITTPPVGCPDPTDPDAVWTPSPNMPPGGYPVSATRLHRLPLPE